MESNRGKKTELYRNWISYIGVLIMIVGTVLIVGSAIAWFSITQPSPYHGIFTYLLFPSFTLFGLVLFLYGMRRESLRRIKAKTAEALPYPRLDLNDPKERKRFGWFLIIASILIVVFGFVGYNAFLFTESTTFCGKVCHKVMEPEYVAWSRGPHARVPCVKCHVGEGVSWFVKSKLSGVHQVFAMLLENYEKPIPVPIKNLRPARETCEQCHWPEKFYGAQLKQNPHFRYDEKNTAEQVSLLIKTGGGSPTLGARAGIHWHMAIDNVVRFASTDAKERDIVWVSVTHRDGTTVEYYDKKTTLSKPEIDTLPKKIMDCMDCHNRPSHVFIPPDQAVDQALETQTISSSLPWIKKVAVDALIQDYQDRETAHRQIKESVYSFYRDRYPAVLKEKGEDIEKTIETMIAIYDASVFPEMGVNWKTYGSNIGHRNWPGCFRCHDGSHITEDGKPLPSDCDLCHTLPQRGLLLPLGSLPPSSNQEWHPMELKGRHREIRCDRCHEAGFRPPMDCAECHRIPKDAPMVSDGCESCHTNPGQKQPVIPCLECHDSLSGLHAKHKASCDACHKPHRWKSQGEKTCLSCHKGYENHQGGRLCATCHMWRD